MGLRLRDLSSKSPRCGCRGEFTQPEICLVVPLMNLSNSSSQNSSETVPDSASTVGTSSSGDGIAGDRSAASTAAATSDDDDDDFHDAVDEINEFEVKAADIQASTKEWSLGCVNPAS